MLRILVKIILITVLSLIIPVLVLIVMTLILMLLLVKSLLLVAVLVAILLILHGFRNPVMVTWVMELRWSYRMVYTVVPHGTYGAV